MNIQQALGEAISGRDLKREDMQSVMQAIMTGEATAAQIAGFLVALRMKGETVDELTAAASVMRELATPVELPHAIQAGLVDTCGTGGDGSRLFNVSTAVAFVVAAAGGKVAKHGNRSVSSSSGSADVFEAAGVKLDIGPDGVKRCIEEVGVGFMFAPGFHSAMKHAIGPRRELGQRTLFNLIGPLTNPAGAQNQVLGVFSPAWVRPLAEVLQALGSNRVMVVHGEDGLDEISVAAKTQVAELKEGQIKGYVIDPADYGLAHDSLKELQVTDAAESLWLIRSVFGGQPGPARDMILINAAAALCVCGLADDMKSGVSLAQQAIDGGGAAVKLNALADLSAGL